MEENNVVENVAENVVEAAQEAFVEQVPVEEISDVVEAATTAIMPVANEQNQSQELMKANTNLSYREGAALLGYTAATILIWEGGKWIVKAKPIQKTVNGIRKFGRLVKDLFKEEDAVENTKSEPEPQPQPESANETHEQTPQN